MNKLNFIRSLDRLVKGGIVIFVILTGLAGYAVGRGNLSVALLLSLIVGIALLSAGSLALNQVQEHRIDALMPRTKKRPLPQKEITWNTALSISLTFLLVGLFLIARVNQLSAWLGIATVILYNGVYTIWLKPRTPQAAILGALPGALPVMMGYAAAQNQIFTGPCLYIFTVMFLWQLPHFWVLALRHKDDYAQANIPVLPAVGGPQKTIRYIAITTLLYLLCVLTYPLFFSNLMLYYYLVLPVSLWVGWEAYRYCSSSGQTKWFRFFLALNTSMLLFIVLPALSV